MSLNHQRHDKCRGGSIVGSSHDCLWGFASFALFVGWYLKDYIGQNMWSFSSSHECTLPTHTKTFKELEKQLCNREST